MDDHHFSSMHLSTVSMNRDQRIFVMGDESNSTRWSLDKIRPCVVDGRNIPVLNISQVGISLQTRTPLVIGQIYVLILKTETRSLVIDGMVVRCHLSELAESVAGGQMPLYHNGIEFHLERNPKELCLLQIIQENLYGEKRLGATRITPIKSLNVDVGRPCFIRVKQLSTEGMLVESEVLLDMDEEWYLLLQLGDAYVEVNSRIVHVSKKDEEECYLTRLEFLDLSREDAGFLERVAHEAAAHSIHEGVPHE